MLSSIESDHQLVRVTTLANVDTSATTGVSFARPAIAYGNDRVMVLWVEESEKSHDFGSGLFRVRRAVRTFSSTTWSNAYVQQIGSLAELGMHTPNMALGFDPVSDLFILARMGDSTNNSELQVSTLSDTAVEQDFPVGVTQVAHILAIGKPVCLESGTPNCAIPFVTSDDRATPTVKYALGSISGNDWVHSSIVNGGYIGYGQVDHAFANDTGLFSVSWQTLSGKTVIHERASLTSAIDTSAEFNTNIFLPAGLGANQHNILPSGTAIRHTAFVVSSW